MVAGLKKGDDALDKTGKKAEGLGGTFDRLASKTTALKAAFAGLAALGIGSIFSKAIAESAKFETRITEISTLVDTATFNLNGLTKSIEAASVAFGSDATVQAAAAYQIVSAGASSAAEATDILNASNRLAVGGVTDVATAADGLTSVLNAYGLASSKAGDVSDALFTGVKAGKTTVDELSRSLGKVAPLAAASGVSFDELVSSVAALTKGGISTTESVTGVRAILAAVTKPTKEASDLAAQLGIDFSASGLKAKGFAGFLQEVTQATGGSTDAMAQLFGGVEAIIPAVALAGQAGVDMSNILDDMAEKGGATAEAFEKMTNTFEFQSNRVRQGLNQALRELGDVITTALTPALKFLADNMGSIITFTKVFATLLAGALIPNMLKLVPTILGASKALIGMAAAFALTPFGAVVTAITAISAALTFFGNKSVEIGGTTATVWQALRALFMTVMDIVRDLANVAVDAFTSFGDTVRGFFDFVFGLLPDFLTNWTVSFDGIGDLIKTAVNTWIGLHVGFVKSVANIVLTGIPAAFKGAIGLAQNFVISGLEGISARFADFANSISGFFGGDGGFSGLDLGGFKADLGDINAELREGFNVVGTVSDALKTDYVGALNEATGFTDKFKQNLNDVVETGKKLEENATTLTDPVVPGLGDAFTDLGEKAGGAKKKTKELNDELERPITIQEGLQDAWKRIGESVKTEGEIVSNTLLQTFEGVGDAIVEFAKTGKLSFKSLAQDVAASVLKMTTQLLLFKAISSFFPGLGSFIGAATGGLITPGGLVKNFAAGGPVTGPGGPRDDKIPAMLSNGEFVVNATATRQFGGLLQQINNGNAKMLRMADGGMAAANSNVSMTPRNIEAAGSGQGGGKDVQVIAQITDGEVIEAIDNPNADVVVLRMLERNPDAVRSIVNG